MIGDLLNPILYRELASIGALDSAISREDKPGFVELFLAAKYGKQASVGQMMSILRAEGETPVVSGGVVEAVLKMQTVVAEWMGTIPTLTAMRLVETDIVAHYERAYDELDGTYKKAIEKAMHRAKKRVMILDAQLANRGGKACMRCHLDRPGQLAALERTDPEPYQYICSACHEEVLAEFPPDIAEKSGQWTRRELENKVLEKAISRSSKLTVESTVLCKLADLAPDMPKPPMPYKNAIDVTGGSVTATQPPAEVEIPPCKSLDERLYTELLFDYESVRRNW
jgi:hypothetical protein